MSTASRMLELVEDQVRDVLAKGWTQQDPEEARKQMEEMYKNMGLDATVNFTKTVVSEPIIEQLPVATDGTIQMGDGDGPEIVVGTSTVETVDHNHVSVCFRVPSSADIIHIDIET